MRKTSCRFCEAPINTGAFANNKQLWSWSIWQFDGKECLQLLSYSCINCFGEIVRLQNIVPRRPRQDEYDVRRARKTRIKWADDLTDHEKNVVELSRLEPKAHLARCAARHAANLIAKATSHKTTKRRKRSEPDEIVIHPPEADDRQMLMLRICQDISHFIERENRDISFAVRRYDTAAIWKEAAHFRRVRKDFGIKGNVCRALKPRERDYSEEDYAWRLRQAFSSFHSYRDGLSKIEADIRTKDHPIIWGYSLVWQRESEAAMFRTTAPLRARLAQYKFEMARYRRRMSA